MRRSLVLFSDRERLAFEFWDDHEVYWTGDRLVVIRHHPHGFDVLEGFIGFAWLPKLAEVWPSIFALPAPARPQPSQPQEAANPEQQQPEEPPPPNMAKAWVPYAMKRWPQEKDENPSDYVDRLLRHAPKQWARKTIQNLLSARKK
jgi:hypothetical protein